LANIGSEMSAEIPMMTWCPGRGYVRYTLGKRFGKYLPVFYGIEFVFFAGGYFLVRGAMFFGDDWFQIWDYPAGLIFGVVGTIAFSALLKAIIFRSDGQPLRLYPDRIEMDVPAGEDGPVTFTTLFQDMISCTVTGLRQNPHSFLIVDLELKPDEGNVFTRKARIFQFGIPAEADSISILKAFEQNQIPVNRH
jgi:hypothetical protein